MDEFSGRVSEAYAARTVADLEHTMRQLPALASAGEPAPVGRRRPGRRMSGELKATAQWLAFPNVVCISIWALSGRGYFWPAWVLLGTGAAAWRRHLGRGRHEEQEAPVAGAVDLPTRPQGAGSVEPGQRSFTTILYCDIVESTRQLATMGDGPWRDTLDAYDTLVASELDRWGGRKLFTRGDEWVAAFDGPARAVRCAWAIRDSARRTGLEIRSGLHAGEVEHRGEDVTGIAMHIGQRVEAAAAPGEILVSSTVRDIVAGSGLIFEDRGEHQLRGVPEAWRLYAVLADTGAPT